MVLNVLDTGHPIQELSRLAINLCQCAYLLTIKPKVIVCLGATAFQTLLQTNRSISNYRGQWLDFRGYKMLPTYHPAYLLRNPAAKADVWKDLQKVMAELGLEVKKTKAK